MADVSGRLPNSLHRQLKQLAEQEGISMNQFISTAVAEKLTALTTAEYLQERAARGDKNCFEKALEKVPDVEAEEEDAAY